MTKPSAFGVALDALRRYILERGLEPGDPLPPVVELARACGVSQATLREALRAWEAAGIVTIRHGVGAFLQAYNYAPLLQNLAFSALFEPDQGRHLRQLREILQVGLLPLALERLTVDDLDALSALTDEMLGNQGGLEAEYQFHARLGHALDNPLLQGLLRLTWLAQRQEPPRAGEGHMPRRLRHALHVEMIEALRAHDATAAQRALRRYLELATNEGAGA